MTVQELYATRVRPLPTADRLRLASLILGDLTVEVPPAPDVSDVWTDEDLTDLTAASAAGFDRSEGDDADRG